VQHNRCAIDLIIPITLVETIQSSNTPTLAQLLKARGENPEQRSIVPDFDTQTPGCIEVFLHRIFTEREK